MTRPALWQAQVGPQEAFLAASEFEVLYGGQKGGGKTDGLIYDAVGQMNHAAGKALFLRRTFPELREVMDRCQAIFPLLGAEWRASDKRWQFQTGATFEFGYAESWAEVQQFAGREYTWLGYDELGNLPEERSWLFLISCLRSRDRSCPVFARGSANPGGPGHAWLKRRFVEPTAKGIRVYRDPDTGLTRRFIPASVYDNPALLAANPQYVAQLKQLPEVLRRQLLEGDWDVGSGFALAELGETSHLIQPFEIPPHWYRFAGFDWGFAHPWWFVGAAQDTEGNVFVTHAATGRLELIDAIADRIKEVSGATRWGVVAGGLDCWHQRKAHGETGPTDAERLQASGLPLIKATVSRVSGLNNLRHYLTFNGRTTPRLRFFDSPEVRKLVEQLRGIVTNPDRPEDSLKVDADSDTGIGGDDGYDALRYAMLLRPHTPAVAKASHGYSPQVSSGRDHLAVPETSQPQSYVAGDQFLGD